MSCNWYWLDFSNVNIQGLSFNLGAQCKDVTGWADGKNVDVSEKEVSQYSTKATTNSGYSGEAPYVYVQRKDAGWDKVMMTNGTIDLANFKGYVRIPIKFFCSEKDTYITTTNTSFGTDKSSIVASSILAWADKNELVAQTRASGDAYIATLKSATQIPVDVAGTPITEALMMQHRYFKCSGCKIVGVAAGADQIWDLGYMPAAAVGADSDDGLYTQTSGEAASKRATVNLSAGTVTRNADTYRAIEDLKTMGFSYENCSTDSLQNSFYVDNIFFYRKDGKAYTENSLNNKPNTGDPMSVYYDEALEISRIIFDEIDKYIEDPDWADYREIEYILDLIETYRQIYESKGRDTAFLSLDKTDDGDGIGLAAAAEKLGRDSWAKAWAAYETCVAAGTYGSANADRYDLVPLIIRAMEKLPAPENITAVSDALRIEIIKIWKAYTLLNIGQLDMLGKAEEEKILKYVALLDGTEKTEDEFVVGQQLADNPFIVFNDFESYELGEKAWQLEDNKDAYSPGFQGGTGNLANDWKHTKNFVTFTTKNGAANITDTEYYGYATNDASKEEEYLDNKVNYNASWATITNNGYMNSNGANLYVDSAFTASENYGAFHTVTLTKDGNPIGADYSNNMSGINLGGIAQGEYKGGDGDTPLSIVFYVDFSEIENFYFTVNLFSHDNNGRMIKARVNMGWQVTDALKQQHWKYFIFV